jgi:hypothetical protein
MLTERGSKPDQQRLPGTTGNCRSVLVPTALPRLEGVISMPDTGVADSDPQLTLDEVSQEFPDWHCYAPGVNGIVFASLRGSSPLVVMRGPDPVALREEIRSWTAVHDNEIAVNLNASLQATAADLSGLANGLAGLGADEEIEQQAEILDRVAEDAGQGAAILRTLIVRRDRAHALRTRRVRPDSTGAYRIPSGPGSEAS